MVKDKIYGITITEKKRINTKKIVILLLLVMVAIGFILVAKNEIESIKQHKVYEQYEAQLASLAKQEEIKQKEVEVEKEKKQKIPTLTRRRKKQHRNHIPFRNQKSFLNF